MERRTACLALVFLSLAVLLCGDAAWAVITRLTPLREVLANQQLIFVADVEKLDPDKPGVVLVVREELKGRCPFRRLPINLTGDSEAKKGQHTPQLLKRLALDLPLVVFADQRDKRFTAFAYTNGTWFQLIGQATDDPATVRWSFTHCEPYLRRTFSGTTAELRQVVVDGLSGKKQPPEPDPKAAPGLGPEIDQDQKREGKPLALAPAGPPRVPLAVIPTFVLVGPLALLASVFGFGGLALLLRRWMVLLGVLCTASTLLLIPAWFPGWLQATGWPAQRVIWVLLAVLTLVGGVWSWLRYRRAFKANDAVVFFPTRGEAVALTLLSVAGVAWVVWGPSWRELMPLWVGLWVGCGYAVVLRMAAPQGGKPRQALPVETVMLAALTLAAVCMLPRRATASSGAQPVWTYEARDRGMIASSPLVSRDRVYFAAAHSSGFVAFGSLYCLDRATGALLWTFTDDGNLKQVFSTPFLADGRLYIGEGFHQDADCKLYCLDAATGRKLWEFATASHTESSPRVVDGRVYFGAGEDGLYCLDAATGREVWHFTGLHVDTSPAVVDGRVYGGSGYGTFEVFCLDQGTGKPVWRMPVELPCFAAPQVAGGLAVFALGNGDFLKSAEEPAGAVLCLEARTGQRLWRYDVPDAVHGRPAVDGERVWFCSRDRHCYCLEQKEGRLLWKQDLGSPTVAAPVLAGGRLVVAAGGGTVHCLDRDRGTVLWSWDLSEYAQARAQLLATPAPFASPDGPRFLYVGAAVESLASSAATLVCLEEP
jgi:outer membrane protein assembly factor BamB